MSTDLIEVPQPAAMLSTSHANPIAPMLEAIMAKDITSEGAATLEKMIELYERVEAKNAQRAFAAAFVALQADVANAGIEATQAVPDRNGVAKFFFAPYKEIMAKVGPLLVKHGFGVGWNMRVDGARIVMECTLTHTGGHEKTNSHATRIGSGPPNASEGQADGSASTMAKRRAICDALNIVVDLDTDARNEGDYIDAATAADLERRVLALTRDPSAFLKLADAGRFTEIREAKLPVLLKSIEGKEAQAAAKPSRDFPNPGLWRTEMLEGFASRGAASPERAFAAACSAAGCSSYLDVPPERRGLAFDALKAGKLDKHLTA